MKRFACEVILTNPNDVASVRAVLADAGCELPPSKRQQMMRP
jgi:hypothetical protein